MWLGVPCGCTEHVCVPASPAATPESALCGTGHVLPYFFHSFFVAEAASAEQPSLTALGSNRSLPTLHVPVFHTSRLHHDCVALWWQSRLLSPHRGPISSSSTCHMTREEQPVREGPVWGRWRDDDTESGRSGPQR